MNYKQALKEVKTMYKTLNLKNTKSRYIGDYEYQCVPANYLSIDCLTTIIMDYISNNNRSALKLPEVHSLLVDNGISFDYRRDLSKLIEAKKFRYETQAGLNQIRPYI